MSQNNTFFAKKLITWYLDNKRELPWRNTKDPYRIWLSEIILQQTRVAQGLPYYEAFVNTYPTVHDLANAPEEAILKLWQGLGYYSRARNLRIAATFVSKELNGVFPERYETLLKLKGVGDYTASAIASICFDEPTAVVDGNVYRVLSRYFGIDIPINTSKGIKAFKTLAQSLIDTTQPGAYNQALMEFGARFCVPKSPDCPSCIFRDSCFAFQKGQVGNLPVKQGKTKVKKRFFNYCVYVSDAKKTLFEQRKGKGIWQNLYQFPLIESASGLSDNAFHKQLIAEKLSENLDILDVIKYNEQPIVHKLSHQHLYTTFWIIHVTHLNKEAIHFSAIEKYPTPILIGNFIERFKGFDEA